MACIAYNRRVYKRTNPSDPATDSRQMNDCNGMSYRPLGVFYLIYLSSVIRSHLLRQLQLHRAVLSVALHLLARPYLSLLQ